MIGARAEKLVGFAIAVVAIALPLRQLIPLDANFFVDWKNHQWLVGYFGEFIRTHHAFPAAITTPAGVGLATPVFYGHLMYPLLGLAAAVLAPGIVLRVAIVAIFVAQYRLVARAAECVQLPRFAARAVACLVVWAIYPLTNLYNRGAVTELFATSLLVCGVAAAVLLLHATTAGERRRYACTAGFAFALAAGSHPITAMLGVPVIVLFGATCAWLVRDDAARLRASLRALAPWAAAAVVVVLPWGIATLRYASRLAIQDGHPGIQIFGDSIDSLPARFAPIPLGDATMPGLAHNDSTPYLEAPANLALAIVLLVIAVGVLARAPRPRRAIGVILGAAAVFAWFAWMSTSTAPYAVLPHAAQIMQFGYRAVTYMNLALLAGVLLVPMALAADDRQRLAARLGRPLALACLGIAVALAAAGVLVKWQHARVVKHRTGSEHLVLDAAERAQFARLPPSYYTADAYAIDGLYPPLDEPPVGDADLITGSADVQLAAAGWLRTNVETFPWSELAIDGVLVAPPALRAVGHRIAVNVPAGAHQLTSEFRPPAWWQILDWLARAGCIVWCLIVVFPWRIAAWTWGRVRSAR